jgi:hypothetical protein
MSEQGEKANSALKEAPKPGEGVDPNHPQRARVEIVNAAQGQVRGERKKFAVCGFASSSRGFIPVGSDEWEIWGLNQLYRHLARADRWFDIHRNWNEEVVPGTDHRAWIRDSGIPVYMVERHPDLPTSVRYPLERLIEAHGADYFTSTIAFMLALAIDEIDQRVDAAMAAEPGRRWSRADVKERYGEFMIGIFGVDLIVGEEYFWQKSCAEFWIGAATARGIQVLIPPQSALCKQAYRYGYEAEPKSPILLSEIEKDKSLLVKTREEKLKELYILDGAINRDEYWHGLMELRLRGMAGPQG